MPFFPCLPAGPFHVFPLRIRCRIASVVGLDESTAKTMRGGYRNALGEATYLHLEPSVALQQSGFRNVT